MKNILAPFFFIYALLLFFISMIPVIACIFLAKLFFAEKKYNEVLHKIFQVWMGIFMPLVFCSVKHFGRHHFKKGKNYVVIINHNSLVDIPVSSPGIPGPNKTLAKIEMSKIPLFGYIYKAGSILVDRKNVRSRQESLKQMKQVLLQGMHLCLYPEGTRNKSMELMGHFHDGAFKIAEESKVDIIPAIILGTKNILHPKKILWAWPNRIEFHFLEPVTVENKNTNALKEECRKIMYDFLLQYKEKL